MSDNNEYEFDELEDEEEAEEEPTSEFKISGQLPLPSASVFTTEQLHGLIHEGFIDLNPPYQRAVVWKQEKQIALVESIFRNYYIPPILFLVQVDEDGNQIRVCMDGKQRLTSIQAFFDGQIPYKDPKTKKAYYYTLPAAHIGRKHLIPEQFRKEFAKKDITCVEYRGIGPIVERDIFQRVQMGMTLTPAEKLAAIPSEFSEWITNLSIKHVLNDRDGLDKFIKWDGKRAKHFSGLAQMVYCIENLPKRTEPTTAKIGPWLSRVDGPSHRLKQEVEQVLTAYWFIAKEDKWNAPFKKIKNPVAPVEFVYIGVLLAVLRDCSYDWQSQEIGKLREYVREQHKDVRMNNRVMSSLWDFIDGAKERAGRNKLDSADGKKRRRANDADDEYRPTPIASLGATPKTRARTAR